MESKTIDPHQYIPPQKGSGCIICGFGYGAICHNVHETRRVLETECDALGYCAVCGSRSIHDADCATYARKLQRFNMSNDKTVPLLNIAPTLKPPYEHLNYLPQIIQDDCAEVCEKERRQNAPRLVTVYILLEHLWQRIEDASASQGYDIFLALEEFQHHLLTEIYDLCQLLARIEARVSTTTPSVDELTQLYQAQYRIDYEYLIKRDQEYHASWLKRGGVGAFMTFCRKWDRFAPMVLEFHENALEMLRAKPDRIDDVQDLRRYLMLVRAEWLRRKTVRMS